MRKSWEIQFITLILFFFFSQFSITVHISIWFTKKKKSWFHHTAINEYFMKIGIKEENRTYKIPFQLLIFKYKDLTIKFPQITR